MARMPRASDSRRERLSGLIVATIEGIVRKTVREGQPSRHARRVPIHDAREVSLSPADRADELCEVPLTDLVDALKLPDCKLTVGGELDLDCRVRRGELKSPQDRTVLRLVVRGLAQEFVVAAEDPVVRVADDDADSRGARIPTRGSIGVDVHSAPFAAFVGGRHESA